VRRRGRVFWQHYCHTLKGMARRRGDVQSPSNGDRGQKREKGISGGSWLSRMNGLPSQEIVMSGTDFAVAQA